MFRNILKIGAALAVAAVTAWSALALDVDQNRNTVARVNTTQQTNYYRFTVNWNDPRISTAQKFGRLLQNTFISNVACHVTTAFNAGTTNVLMVGTSATTPVEIISAAISTKSIDESSATYQQITQAGSLGVSVTSGADVDLYARYQQTGTAATAGAATCIIEFVPNNDM
jgi:hypothetical protein